MCVCACVLSLCVLSLWVYKYNYTCVCGCLRASECLNTRVIYYILIPFRENVDFFKRACVTLLLNLIQFPLQLVFYNQ